MIQGTEVSVRMPAEWEPHDCTWLAYPRLASDWPGKLWPVRWALVEFARKLAGSERVELIVQDPRERRLAMGALRRAGADTRQVRCHELPTDRSWLRDSGPTFVLHGDRLRAVCWGFNAWGRYANWQADKRVAPFIAQQAKARPIEPRALGRRVIMEGGAIDSNGNGSILSTEQCLLAKGRHARNPGLTRDEIEAVLAQAVGATNVLWLTGGIAGDDTGGHVDTVARFAGPNLVAAAVETDRRDPNHRPLAENLKRLRSMRDERGRQIDIAELPMPERLDFDGWRLPASYANFYIANEAVLVPTFNDPSDRVALRVLEECFPGREVCGIHCVDLVLGQGTLHCLAQQQPASRSTPKDPAAKPTHKRTDGDNVGVGVVNVLPDGPV